MDSTQARCVAFDSSCLDRPLNVCMRYSHNTSSMLMLRNSAHARAQVRLVDCGKEQGPDIDDAMDLEMCRGIALHRAETLAPIQIGERLVGPGSPCLIIAEAGVNHNGDMELARQLIDVAVDAGADVVKFQSFQVRRMRL